MEAAPEPQTALDRILYDVEARGGFLPNPLSAANRAALIADLGRVSALQGPDPELRIRDPGSRLATYGAYMLHGFRLSNSPRTVRLFADEILAYRNDRSRKDIVAIFRERGNTVRGLPVRSFAGLWYAWHLGPEDEGDPSPDPSIWERDDVAAMERLWHRKIELDEFSARALPGNQLGQDLFFDIAEWLYHPETPGYTGLIDRLTRYKIDWRALARTVYLQHHETDVALTRTAIVQALEEAAAAAEEAEFGRGAPLQRAAADEFDLQRGSLSANCARWTYPELEFWSRLAVAKASASMLCSWLRTREEIEIEGECEKLPLLEIQSMTLQAVAFVPKSALCALLAATGTPAPQPMNWDDVSHFNIRVLDYLPRESLPPLVAPDTPYALFRPIADDLIRKLLPQTFNVTTRHEILRLTPQSQPITLAIDTGRTQRSFIVLEGVLVVSLVSAEYNATPELIALREGQLLVASPRGVGDYELLILRAGTERVTVLAYTLS